MFLLRTSFIFDKSFCRFGHLKPFLVGNLSRKQTKQGIPFDEGVWGVLK
jgi:hypothetical protein